MTVRVKVEKVDLGTAKGKGRICTAAATAAMVLAARRDSEPYVPYRQGDLRLSAETESQPERSLLKYGSAAVPYARPQYYGYPNKTWPGTAMKWFDKAKAAHLPEWMREAQAAARKAAGR